MKLMDYVNIVVNIFMLKIENIIMLKDFGLMVK